MQYPNQNVIWNTWNTLNKRLQYASETLVAYVTSWSTFATSIWNTCNISLKHLKHWKHTFATCAFSTISPCCLGWRLGGGAELAASVEKAVTDPVEKATVGPWAGEACDRQEAWWWGRKTGCCGLMWMRCQPVEWRCDRVGGAVESIVAKAARWSTVAESCRGATLRWVFS
jgi:hypothetical protein